MTNLQKSVLAGLLGGLICSFLYVLSVFCHLPLFVTTNIPAYTLFFGVSIGLVVSFILSVTYGLRCGWVFSLVFNAIFCPIFLEVWTYRMFDLSQGGFFTLSLYNLFVTLVVCLFACLVYGVMFVVKFLFAKIF